MKLSKRNWLLLFIGGLCGFVNGFFGGSGGMLLVPFLIAVLAYEIKPAHATALLIMLPVSVLSAVIYLLSGTISLKVALPVTIGFTIGGVVGALCLKKVNDKVIKYVFAGLIFIAGVKLLFF